MKRRLLILAVLAAALAGGYYFYLHPRWTNKSTNVNVMKLSGNIETHESVVGFKVQGRIVDLPVKEGQWVEEGTLLAKLDSDDYRQQVAMDQANVGVQRAQLELGLAGTRRQQLRVVEKELEDAKADFSQKQIDFKRADSLYREGVGPQNTRDQAETNLKRAQATFERAQQEYDQAQEGTRKEELDVSRATLVQAEQKLRLSKINLEYTTLRAPTSGVILVRQAELGEVVLPGTPVVTLGDLNHVWLRAYVSETDLGRIRWGRRQ